MVKRKAGAGRTTSTDEAILYYLKILGLPEIDLSKWTENAKHKLLMDLQQKARRIGATEYWREKLDYYIEILGLYDRYKGYDKLPRREQYKLYQYLRKTYHILEEIPPWLIELDQYMRQHGMVLIYKRGAGVFTTAYELPRRQLFKLWLQIKKRQHMEEKLRLINAHWDNLTMGAKAFWEGFPMPIYRMIKVDPQKNPNTKWKTELVGVAYGRRSFFTWAMQHGIDKIKSLSYSSPLGFETRNLKGQVIPNVKFRISVVIGGQQKTIYVGTTDSDGCSPVFKLPASPTTLFNLPKEGDQTAYYVMEMEFINEQGKYEYTAIEFPDPELLTGIAWINPHGSKEWGQDFNPWHQPQLERNFDFNYPNWEYWIFTIYLKQDYRKKVRLCDLNRPYILEPILTNEEIDGAWLYWRIQRHGVWRNIFFPQYWIAPDGTEYIRHVFIYQISNEATSGTLFFPYPPEGEDPSTFKTFWDSNAVFMYDSTGPYCTSSPLWATWYHYQYIRYNKAKLVINEGIQGPYWASRVRSLSGYWANNDMYFITSWMW